MGIVPVLDFPENFRAGNITEDDNKLIENFEEKKTERMTNKTNKTNKTQKSLHKGHTNRSKHAVIIQNVEPVTVSVEEGGIQEQMRENKKMKSSKENNEDNTIQYYSDAFNEGP